MRKYSLRNIGERSLVTLLATGIIALTTNCATSSKDLAKFSAGLATGLGIHEGSHYVVAKTQGMDPEYDFKHPTSISYKKYTSKKNNEKAIVSGAGLVSQTLATEVILNTEKIPKDNSYVLGILAFSIGDNLRYGLFPNLRGKELSDVNHLDKAGIKKEYVQGALIAHSIFSLYRLIKNKDFKNKFDFLFDYNENKKSLEFKIQHRF